MLESFLVQVKSCHFFLYPVLLVNRRLLRVNPATAVQVLLSLVATLLNKSSTLFPASSVGSALNLKPVSSLFSCLVVTKL